MHLTAIYKKQMFLKTEILAAESPLLNWIQELDNAFRGTVLTKDNMVKLVDIAERLRAKLSCILLGEAGCGKTVPWMRENLLGAFRGCRVPVPNSEIVSSGRKEIDFWKPCMQKHQKHSYP